MIHILNYVFSTTVDYCFATSSFHFDGNVFTFEQIKCMVPNKDFLRVILVILSSSTWIKQSGKREICSSTDA